MINDDDAINKEIVKVLSKGPERVRVLSREELRMEIKRLTGEVNSLKLNGATKKKKSKKGSEKGTEEDVALEESFDNMTFEKFKELKVAYDLLQSQLDAKDKQLVDAQITISNMRDDMKGFQMSQQTLMDKVKEMGEDKKIFEQVKAKLREFKASGLFKGIELDVSEEHDNDAINLLNKFNKLIDKIKDEIDQRDKENYAFKNKLEQSEKDKLKEVDELIDEYNQKDEAFQSLNDKYIALKREMKMKMQELAKCREELQEQEKLVLDLKDEYKGKLSSKKEEMSKNDSIVAELKEEIASRDKKIEELKIELETQLQRPGGYSEDSSMEFDPLALAIINFYFNKCIFIYFILIISSINLNILLY